MFDEEASQVPEDEQLRRARIILNKTKLDRMLGRINGATPTTEQLLGMYLEFAKLDERPEKGERKFADDFVLILDEVLSEVTKEEPRN